MDTIVRDHQIRLVRAFVARLEADSNADVHAGLCALVGHVQGGEPDASERMLLACLSRDVLDTFVPSANA